MAEHRASYDISPEVDPPYAEQIDTTMLRAVAETVLAHEGIAGPLELGIWITNQDEVHTLNRTYRGVDASTDVLSFGAEESVAPFVTAPDEVRYLGDIAISFDHVVRQAEEYNHSRQRELAYLLTHGILHLLGYDHEEPEQAREMRAHEEQVLGALGITRDADDAAAGR